MDIECIDNLEELEKAKAVWDEVYRSDPHATIHRSWPWIKGWIAGTTYQWSALAFRSTRDSPYVAFIPLAIDRTKKDAATVYMGGHPLSAHTGFLCVPAYAEQVMSVFADYFTEQRAWARFVATELLDPRIELFVNFLPKARFAFDYKAPTICPYIELPQTWQDHLNGISPKARYKVRKLLRETGRLHDFKVVSADGENLDQQISVLLSM